MKIPSSTYFQQKWVIVFFSSPVKNILEGENDCFNDYEIRLFTKHHYINRKYTVKAKEREI